MRHLTGIASLSREEIQTILWSYQQEGGVSSPGPIGLVFHEPSTRTRFSFASAALRVGCHPIDLNVGESSEQKGETTLDTCRNLVWAGAKALVLRTRKSNLPEEISRQVSVPVVNAGDGMNEHPTQALGDAITLQQQFGHLDGLRITIVGDIAGSRVARSNALLLSLFGADVRLVGSRIPSDLPGEHYTRESSFVKALTGVDVVMLLRWQDERHLTGPVEHKIRYQVTEALLADYAPNAVVMHPGPVNRGVEVTDEVIDGPRSLVQKQVENGVLARAAVLRYVLS